jgi:hypothetical protein
MSLCSLTPHTPTHTRAQGPRPHEYLHFFKTYHCPNFGGTCEQGIRQGLCPYMKKWHQLLNDTESDVGLTMWYACLALYAPHLRGLSRHKLAQHS